MRVGYNGVMKLHLIGFPHTQATDEYSTCAYTQKIVKFSRMKWDNLFVYANEGSELGPGAQLVEILTEKERLKIFGKNKPKEPPKWPTDEEWKLFNSRASLKVLDNSEPGDLLLLAGGLSQAPILEYNSHLLPCEPGIGYEGVFTAFCAFESYAWQHHIYAKYGWDGRWFDRVIPNYFDTNEFPFLNEGDGDHLLFVGRVVQRKGLQAAMDIARASGLPLKVAGPGPTKWRKGRFLQAPEVTIRGNVEYIGVLPPLERAEAMSKALAVLAPTVYVEPFGGVAVESMLSGTPVIATDWGAFTETVNAQGGIRFRTLNEAVKAVNTIESGFFNPRYVKDYAIRNYSLEAVKTQFVDWFNALDTLRTTGWYHLD